VVSECRADAQSGTLRQSLQIRQGEQAPITVVEHSTSGFSNARAICEDAGRNRQGTRFTRWGVFHRLGVTADGSQVVFEVTDDLAPTVVPANSLSAEQEGIFVVRADGSGLRRLGAASAEPPYGAFAYTWPFLASSPDSRLVTYTDRGPSLDNEDAIQIFTLDLASGDARQITRLPPAPEPRWPCGSTGCPVFNDDQTIAFITNADLDGTNPGGQNISVTVKTDGTGLTVFRGSPIPGSSFGELSDHRFQNRCRSAHAARETRQRGVRERRHNVHSSPPPSRYLNPTREPTGNACSSRHRRTRPSWAPIPRKIARSSRSIEPAATCSS
jgi:hypothetical protein